MNININRNNYDASRLFRRITLCTGDTELDSTPCINYFQKPPRNYDNIKPFYDERDKDPDAKDCIDYVFEHYPIKLRDVAFSRTLKLYDFAVFSEINEILSEHVHKHDKKTKFTLQRLVDFVDKSILPRDVFVDCVIESSSLHLLETLIDHKFIDPHNEITPWNVIKFKRMYTYANHPNELVCLNYVKKIYPTYVNPNYVEFNMSYDKNINFPVIYLIIMMYPSCLEYLISIGLNVRQRINRFERNGTTMIIEICDHHSIINNTKETHEKIELISRVDPKCLFNRTKYLEFPVKYANTHLISTRMFEQFNLDTLSIEITDCVSEWYVSLNKCV